MAVDIPKLRESIFWNKKIDRAVRSHDTNKSGDISRADFLLIRERYKSLGTSTPQHIELLTRHQSAILERLHLDDESVRLSYAELKEKMIEDLANVPSYEAFIESMFQNLDMNGDGVISFEDWKAHYYCTGVDQAHARASFGAMDANGDGVVSKEEFLKFHCEYFFTADNKLGSSILYGPLE